MKIEVDKEGADLLGKICNGYLRATGMNGFADVRLVQDVIELDKNGEMAPEDEDSLEPQAT